MRQTDLNRDSAEVSYETRELAWELQQEHPDQQRIRLFLEQGADVRHAMTMAGLQENDLTRRPMLKPLQLQRHLGVTARL